MIKNKKTTIIITIGALCLAVLAICLTVIIEQNMNPIKDTEWIGQSESILTLGDTDYSWTNNSDSATGTYSVYSGRKANKFLDDFTEKYIAEMNESIPESEKYGIEDEIDKFRKSLKNKEFEDLTGITKTFILEEKLEKTTINGEEIEPESNVYYCALAKADGKQHMYFKNVTNYLYYEFISKEDYVKPEGATTILPDKIKAVDDNTTSDKNLSFTYKVPDGYEKISSESGHVFYVKDRDMNCYINISVMTETPMTGIMDEFPKGKEYNDGYKATQQAGPFITCNYLFEKNGTTYLITSESKTDFESFVDSIEK